MAVIKVKEELERKRGEGVENGEDLVRAESIQVQKRE
jgi:hypothetical protein